MPKNLMSTSAFEVIRVRFDSTRSFDAVKSALLSRMGAIRPDEIFQAIQKAQTAEDVERALTPFVGESGFMLFSEIDHSRWLPLYGIKRKATRWIFGNPMIAITMIRHEITASLFAPVELLLLEEEQGSGCTVVYDLPSSLMQAKQDPQLLKAAQALDGKMQALVSQATGIAPD